MKNTFTIMRSGLASAALGLVLSASFGVGSSMAQDAAKAAAVYTDVDALVADAQKEGTLNVYLPPEYVSFFIDGFKKAYPWATVNYTGLEPPQTIAKWSIELSAGVKTLDVAGLYIAQVAALKQMNALAQISVPNDAKIREALQDPDHYFHSMIWFPYVVMYNTQLLSAGPEDLTDLTAPEWKGKIAFDNPALGGSTALTLSAVRTELGHEKWESWLKDLKANEPYLTESASTSYATVVRGDRALCICSYHDYVSQAEGTPVAADFYNQATTGIVPQVGVMVAAADAPHPHMAALFLNYILTEEAQTGVMNSGRAPVVEVPGGEKVNVPDDVKVASPTNEMAEYLADPASANAVYKQIFTN